MIEGAGGGAAPAVDLAAERINGDFVRAAIGRGWVSACHDVADGGLLVALAEMALAGGVGVRIEAEARADPAYWFGEDQARYVVAIGEAHLGALRDEARRAGVALSTLGITAGKDLTAATGPIIPLGDLRAAHEGWMPDYMEGGGAHGGRPGGGPIDHGDGRL